MFSNRRADRQVNCIVDNDAAVKLREIIRRFTIILNNKAEADGQGERTAKSGRLLMNGLGIMK